MNKKITAVFIIYLLLQIFISAMAENSGYNFENYTKIKIPLKIEKKVSTGGINKLHEGDTLAFCTRKNVYYKNKLIIKEGERLNAKVKIIIKRGLAGIPAEIYLGEFEFENGQKFDFIEPVEKRGLSMTVWILPVKWALTFLPPFGSLTNIIIGGNAIIRPGQEINLYCAFFD